MFARSFDTESTGIPEEEDRHALVEVGYADIYDGVVFDWNARLCNPGRKIPIAAKAIHHITDEMVANEPPPDVILRWFGEANPDVYFAHNAEHDLKFIGINKAPILCTYKISLRFWPDAENFKNQYLRYYLDLPVDQEKAEPAHRAGPDAYVTGFLAARILDEADERGISIETMAKWSKGPALLPRISFGKHKGLKWEEAPTDYLRWILDKSDMERDVKANAKHHLKLKGML